MTKSSNTSLSSSSFVVLTISTLFSLLLTTTFLLLSSSSSTFAQNVTNTTTTIAPGNLNPQIASSNGSYCECIFSLDLYCTPVKLVLVPYAGHEFSSDASFDFTSGKWIVPANVAIPRLVLEWRTVDTDTLVTQIDGTFNATVSVSIGARDGDGALSGAVASQTPRSGRYIFQNSIIPLINNADTSIETTAIRLNFTTPWGPFAVTPVIEIYRRPPAATIYTTSDVHIEISSSLKTVIENANRIVIGKTLPDFTISVVDVAGQTVNFFDGNKVMVYGTYGLEQYPTFRFEAQISSGVALFRGVMFDSSVIDNQAMQLVFYIRSPSIPPYDPTTPLVNPILAGELPYTTDVFRVIKVPVNNEYFGFGSDEDSYVYDGASMRSAVVGEPLPRIRVRAFDSSGVFDSTTPNGEVYLTVSSLGGSRIAFAGRTEALIQGKADFHDLTFLRWLPDSTGTLQPYQDVVLSFNSQGRAQNGKMVGTTLNSMIFRVYINAAAAPAVVGMRLVKYQRYNPAFWYDGQTRYMVRYQQIDPIQVELVDVLNDRATTGAGTLTVSADPIGWVDGTPITTTFVNGFATITGVTPKSYEGAKTTITIAYGSWKINLYIITLQTLRRCWDIRFGRDYFSSMRMREPVSFNSFQNTFDPIVVEVIDSNLKRDTSCQTAVITARSNAQIGGTEAAVTNGRAVFPSLSFASLGAYQLQFSAADPVFTNLTGKSIFTGQVDIEETTVEQFALEFDPNGHVRFAGHGPAIAVGDLVPAIGVRVINTARQITPPLDGVMNIRVNCSRGCTLEGTTTQPVSSIDGTAWFSDLVLKDKVGGTNNALLVFPYLTFYAEVVNATRDDSTAPVVVGSHFELKSGPLNVKPMGTQALGLVLIDNLNIVPLTNAPAPGSNATSDPAMTTTTTTTTTLAPSNSSTSTAAPSSNSSSNTTSAPSSTYTEPPGFSYVGDLLIVTSLRSTNIRFNTSTTIGTTVAIRGPGSTYYLPTNAADQVVTAKSPSGILNGSSFSISTMYGSTPQAQFPNIEINTVPYIQNEITTVEFSNPLVDDPLVVGPFQNSELLYDPSLTVIVAELKQSWTTFSYTRWSNHLADFMKINPDRILRGRVSPGGGVVTGKAFTWMGVRVEFAFLPPTTQSSNKLSPRLLTEMFLSVNDPCTGLSLRSKYALVNETDCDAFRLSQAVAAAKRCIETSGPADRCTCHMPFFRSMSRYCSATDTFGSVCAQLTTCKSDIISDACSDFKAEIAASYAKIFGALVAVIGFLVVFGLWVNGVFDQTKKTKLETKNELGTIKKRTNDPDFYEAL